MRELLQVDNRWPETKRSTCIHIHVISRVSHQRGDDDDDDGDDDDDTVVDDVDDEGGLISYFFIILPKYKIEMQHLKNRLHVHCINTHSHSHSDS